MAVLGRIELENGLRQGSYVANPRIIDGEYPDLQNASYDLTAGVAVWRESGKARNRWDYSDAILRGPLH